MQTLSEMLNHPWTVRRFIVVTIGAVAGLACAMLVSGRWPT